VHVGLGHDFHEGSAGTIDIDKGMNCAALGTFDVDETGDVFFHVDSVDANSYRIFEREIDEAFVANRLIHLGDLVALHEVRVGVVLAVELGDSGDVAIDRHADHHGVLDGSLVYDRERAGKRHADFVYKRVWLSSLILGAGCSEHFGTRLELHVRFETNYCFVLHVLSIILS